MKEYIVKIPEAEVETISNVLEKFGAEMIPVKIKKGRKKTIKPAKKSKIEKIDHTYLFGKWKDLDIDARKLREQSW
ncbi:MAG: hypothetical protein M3Z92_07415 [Bacteroidota bacterium]|nr:hypothetical protein [Bacteroidota bacterium]MDQ6888767.1 hypothetical protein [Bacteroidota bacterium]